MYCMDQITSFLKELKRLGIADAWLVGGVVRDWVRKKAFFRCGYSVQ
jgi:hypothetical protein